ncbi:GNAT family N-acetyltransferase [Sinimarinibacterium sp. CAU 1509]|uniref:GNAT family N-acetyltransferase n=1 Tax=Sinimarinibacterium sp. CAU 1509 TaxID=2562283 RepID=UPI0010ACE990|nr:GNAT family N-acetyltransferase [Sinimarinibacterium sp. CAU 1509]TJY55174.1 GNAT family N-acetyltransferase [Sinimarinibacterium sp. CAU 1509]
MPEALHLRPATEADAPEISALILGLADFFVDANDRADATAFFDSLSPSALRTFIADPTIDAWIARAGDVLLGVASMKDRRHLYHLFISPEAHGQGIATQLWMRLKARALEQGHRGAFTVNSSMYAVPVYQRFGFVTTSPPQTRHGVRYQPMQLTEGAQ